MRIHITRISPGSLSITFAAIYGLLGVVIALLGAFGALAQFGLRGSAKGLDMDMLPMLIFQPILSALIGAVTGIILAWIYNAIARFTKGILIEYNEAGRHDD
jgi:hypothetical protein